MNPPHNSLHCTESGSITKSWTHLVFFSFLVLAISKTSYLEQADNRHILQRLPRERNTLLTSLLATGEEVQGVPGSIAAGDTRQPQAEGRAQAQGAGGGGTSPESKQAPSCPHQQRATRFQL